MPPLGPQPQVFSVNLANGVLTCTPDVSDCGYFPKLGDQFRLVWDVCNSGTMPSPAMNSLLYEYHETNLEDTYDQSVPSTAPGACVRRMSEPFSIDSPGYWHWDVHINGVVSGGTGETF